MIETLESIVILARGSAAFFAGVLAGNAVAYFAILGRLYNLDFKEGVRFSRGVAERALEKIDKKGCLYNNLHFGQRSAYETFLEETS